MALTKEQIKEFKEEEKDAEDCFDFYNLAENLVKAGDKDWAKKVYKKSYKKKKT